MVKSILAVLLAIVIILSAILIGACVYLKQAKDVDLVGSTAHAISVLTEPIEKEDVCDYPFDMKKDMANVQFIVNESVENMIEYQEQNGYKVHFENLPDEMKEIISLSDKQVGALAQTVLMQESVGQVQVNDLYMDIEIYQIKFDKDVNDGNILVNAVFGIDTTQFRQSMAGTPLEGVIPEILYVSSVNKVIKGEEAFTYTLEHVSLELNHLTPEQTEDFFRTIDLFAHVGTAEYLNGQVGKALIGSLVGSETQRGLAYSLKDIGARDFEFQTQNGEIYFVVVR